MAKLFKEVALPVAGGVLGFMFGGPAGAAAGAALGSSLGGGNTKRNMKWGAVGGLGGLSYGALAGGGGLGGLGGASSIAPYGGFDAGAVAGADYGLGSAAGGTASSGMPAWMKYARMGNMASNFLGGGQQGGGGQQPYFGPGGSAQVAQGENRNPFAGWPQMNPYGPSYGRY